MNALEQKITDVLQRAVDHQEAAGYTVLIRQHGEQIAYAQAGHADRETQRPVARDSIFRLYSQSKPVTAVAVMMLIERGLLDAMDPVSDFLPGFANQQVWTPDGLVPAKRPVQIMDLLGMTAGLCYPGTDDVPGLAATKLFEQNAEAMANGSGMNTVEFANAIGELPLAFQPGSTFRYSTCADVLGAVVEVISGKPFARFLQEEIFTPLGMKDTGFWVPIEKQDRLVTCYAGETGTLVPYHQQHLCVGDYTSKEPLFASGGAGLVSTLDDYARFAQMLLNKGTLDGVKLLSPATVDWLLQPQLMLADWEKLPGHGYGKLLRVCVDPGQALGLAVKGEYGWDGWLGTYFANFPDQDVTMLLFQNLTNAGTTACARKVRNVVLSTLFE